MELLLDALKYVSFVVTAVTGYIGATFETTESGKDQSGRKSLTRFGRINRRLLIVSLLTGFSIQVIGDVTDRQAAAKRALREEEKQTALLREIQRGVYPLSGLSLAYQLRFKPAEEQLRTLRQLKALPTQDLRAHPACKEIIDSLGYILVSIRFGRKELIEHANLHHPSWPAYIAQREWLETFKPDLEQGAYYVVTFENDELRVAVRTPARLVVRTRRIASLLDLPGQPVEVSLGYTRGLDGPSINSAELWLTSESTGHLYKLEAEKFSMEGSPGASEIVLRTTMPEADQYQGPGFGGRTIRER